MERPPSPEIGEKKFGLNHCITNHRETAKLYMYVLNDHREHTHLIKMYPHVSKQVHEQKNPCYLQSIKNIC